ncbi:hypothetical protein B0T21DRAFT_402870 [Apiosordaria backusii]|uniref:Uncharacterized protein n=1 Tax=Apiosordaria backusii TaxID=314023 RepID=A0AA40EEZ4_9PEZI|nr:hypothetical protein B0T21DRAFT_402870 [Apiosordaria backusii]
MENSTVEEAATDRLGLDSLLALSGAEDFAKLEAGVSEGLRLLMQAKAAFQGAQNVPEVSEWLQSMSDLQEHRRPQRTVVGEALLPTNCMRACTAVITEIGYNTSSEPDQKYRAEIEFISAEDWSKELEILVHDIEGGQATFTSETVAGDTEAAVAYQKIRAVYPRLKGDDIKKGKFLVQNLVDDHSVRNFLGSVMTINEPTANNFLNILQSFIDSKEKTRGKKKESNKMEFWPLIKVVRIFVAAEILRSGLVLVDLPGIHDSNAARSAIASKYIEQCTGLWVVAPITRAVDDQAAKLLLGNAFRRQLQFDGTYSAVTVICSKADDIVVTEILKTLPEDELASKLHEKIQLLESELTKTQQEHEPLVNQLADIQHRINQHEEEAFLLKPAIQNHDGDADEIVVTSPQKSRKRSNRAAAKHSRKRVRQLAQEDSDNSDSNADDSTSPSENEAEKEHIPLDTAMKRLEELESELERLRTARQSVKTLMKPGVKKLKDLRREIKNLTAQRKSECIKYRNEYSRPEIQRQFAEGIREIDLDNASRSDGAFDPNQPQRDYEEVAKKLKVFCVSSKGYQKMLGRLASDETVGGFFGVEDTEIPSLKRHALEIVSNTLASTHRSFLRDLCRILTILHLRVVIADQPLKLADELKEKETEFLTLALQDLQNNVTLAINRGTNNLLELIDVNIFQLFPAAERIASAEAIGTVEGWGARKNDGGLAWNTFRATCVRAGVFKGEKGQINLNSALARPLMAHIAAAWERVFKQDLPKALEAMAEDIVKQLTAFKKSTDKREELKKLGSFPVVRRQVKLLERGLKDVSEFRALAKSRQKEASRMPVPIIAECMSPAYRFCQSQGGEGVRARMNQHMAVYINTVRVDMFGVATTAIERALRKLVSDIKKEIQKKAQRAVDMIHSDYRALLVDQEAFKVLEDSRGSIYELLLNADEGFSRIMSGLPPAPEFDMTERMASIGLGEGETAESVPNAAAAEVIEIDSDNAANDPSAAPPVRDTRAVNVKLEHLASAPPPTGEPAITSDGDGVIIKVEQNAPNDTEMG